jgi:hypothetical protein
MEMLSPVIEVIVVSFNKRESLRLISPSDGNGKEKDRDSGGNSDTSQIQYILLDSLTPFTNIESSLNLKMDDFELFL